MKKYLITGLIILLPIVLTAIVIAFLFNMFARPFGIVVEPLINFMEFSLGWHLPVGLALLISRILSLLLLCVLILALGFFTQHFLVKTTMSWLHAAIRRIPFVNTVYKVSMDVFAALFSADGKQAFKHPIMVPFPSQPNFALGLASGEVAREIQDKLNRKVVSVFLPTAPHPISGFLFFVPQNDVKAPQMTKEEVVKFLISCGTILPESEKKETDEYF